MDLINKTNERIELHLNTPVCSVGERAALLCFIQTLCESFL